MSDLSVNYGNIEAAANHLRGVAHKTPVMTSRTVNEMTQNQVFFKCENFQRTGSFKFRGAYNALVQLSKEEKQQGVLAYSSGNHAQAIALASQLLGISATIIMPEDAPEVKQKATREYGAEVILYDKQEISREELAATLSRDRALTVIPPYNRAEVIAGQGTTAKELIEEVGELDTLLVCCGGGGLLSGCAIAAKTLSPGCQVIGVEPANADDAARSFHSKQLHRVHNPDTIADGARTPSLGELTFPLILHYVDDLVTVSELAILQTMFFLWERMKIVVEPTGALAAAALLEGMISLRDRRVGVIISGGNVDVRGISRLSDDIFAKVWDNPEDEVYNQS
ncbi:threo-3-hydroxy-L-aspartate ammonia-lyase [Phormidium pseudopriestleyi FRX01]|uniref:Threo-3-hydroxy-L-aspartate ammonia-lyase n=1 Tax=Phormidium pseudopriestleyi FRX01 TaxID=1759528 RepID=A0ABS3FQJ6_9CYAN|nr:threo-3-hydroxy-L-aspartate ammonia-lyase [Phormidium pseudopriestleyi]MBO0349394.1 threo-3-hydroxy-L-aspartate ammonia-lyase [Phormidium pseudopriestleyi FRX01]